MNKQLAKDSEGHLLTTEAERNRNRIKFLEQLSTITRLSDEECDELSKLQKESSVIYGYLILFKKPIDEDEKGILQYKITEAEPNSEIKCRKYQKEPISIKCYMRKGL